MSTYITHMAVCLRACVCVRGFRCARTHTHTHTRSRARTHAHAGIQMHTRYLCECACVFVWMWLCGCRAVHAPLSQPACKANKVRLLLLSVDRDREAVPVAPVLCASRRQERVWNPAPLDPCVVLPCERCLARRFLFAISLGGLWLTIVEDR